MMDPGRFFASLFAPRHPNSAETPSPHRPVCDPVPSPDTGRILPFGMAQWSSVMTTSTPVHPLGVTYEDHQMMNPGRFFASLFAPRHPNSAETPSPHRPVCDPVPSPDTGRILPFRLLVQRSVMTTSTPVHPLGVTYAADRFRAGRGLDLDRSRIRT